VVRKRVYKCGILQVKNDSSTLSSRLLLSPPPSTVRDLTSDRAEIRSVSRGYWRGADGFVVVYSITDRQSFQRVEKWVGDIESFVTDAALVLVGTKCDMEDQRVVSTEEGQALATSLGTTLYLL